MRIIDILKVSVTVLAAAALFGCGTEEGSQNVVNGVAQAGIFSSGTAVFSGYSGANKNKEYVLKKADGTPLTATFAASNAGKFSADLGSYTGPVKISVYGSYTDEATGNLITVPASTPIKSIVPATALSSGKTVPVTPLTDISANLIAAGLHSASSPTAASDLITQTNTGVGKLFGLTDVTATIPVTPTVHDLTAGTTTTAQAAYTVALVKLSEYVKEYATNAGVPADSAALSAAMKQISGGVTISGSSSTPTVSTSLSVGTALTTALSTPTTIKNDAGASVNIASAVPSVVSAISTSVGAVSTPGVKYKVILSSPTATSVYGVQIALTVPTNVSVPVDAHNVTTVGVLTTGAGITGTGLIVGTLSGGTLTLTSDSGTAVPVTTQGTQFAILLSTVTGTAPASLSVVSVSAMDQNGVLVPGVTATVVTP